MKFIDLFAGIGGFRTGMEMNGHECVAFCGIDKYARQSYKAIYDTEGEEEWHDITTVSDDTVRRVRGRVDIITGGFPCQAFSVAGSRRGFEDTRGTLFFEIARAIKEIEPSYILLENVKGLFSHDKGRTFGTIIQALDELGYIVEWGLFNSKFWGVPQNRERVFILVTRKDVFKAPKLFDLLKKQTEVNTKLIDVLESEVDEKYFLSDERVEQLNFNAKRDSDIKQIAQYDTEKRINANAFRVYDPTGISPTLNTMQGGNLEPCVRVEGVANTLEASGVNQGVVTKVYGSTQKNAAITDGDISPTLTSSMGTGGGHVPMPVFDNLRIRKLTPLECFRLQGFTDE